jgi:hypothetical protein
MTVTAGLNRYYKLEVAAYVDGETPVTYSKVGGVTSYTPLSNEKGREDDTEFDSDGRMTEMGTTLSSTITATVKIPEAGKAADPGQAIVSAAGNLTGSEGFIHYKETHTQTGEVWTGIADASYTPQGGEQAGFTTAEISLAVRSATASTAP